MQYYIRVKGDPYMRRWGVRQAVSLRAAMEAIDHARVTGSIGHTDTLTKYDKGVATGITLASVIQVNSDNSPRIAYTERY